MSDDLDELEINLSPRREGSARRIRAGIAIQNKLRHRGKAYGYSPRWKRELTQWKLKRRKPK